MTICRCWSGSRRRGSLDHPALGQKRFASRGGLWPRRTPGLVSVPRRAAACRLDLCAARVTLEKMLTYANRLGLCSEEIAVDRADYSPPKTRKRLTPRLTHPPRSPVGVTNDQPWFAFTTPSRGRTATRRKRALMLPFRSDRSFLSWPVLGIAVLLWVLVGCSSDSSSTDATSTPTAVISGRLCGHSGLEELARRAQERGCSEGRGRRPDHRARRGEDQPRRRNRIGLDCVETRGGNRCRRQ